MFGRKDKAGKKLKFKVKNGICVTNCPYEDQNKLVFTKIGSAWCSACECNITGFDSGKYVICCHEELN